MEIKWATLLLASEQERHMKNLALCLNLPNLTRKKHPNTVKLILAISNVTTTSTTQRLHVSLTVDQDRAGLRFLQERWIQRHAQRIDRLLDLKIVDK